MRLPPAPESVKATSAEFGLDATVNAAARTIVVVAFIAAMYYGRAIFIPLALSILLSFALAPLARRIHRVGVPRVPSVIVAVLVAFMGITAVTIVIGGQIFGLADSIPRYKANIAAKIESIQQMPLEGGVFERVLEAVEDFYSLIPSVAPAASDALTVQIQAPPTAPVEAMRDAAAALVGSVGWAFMVGVLVIFMLLEREDLRDRVIRLLGGGDLRYSTQALNDAASRVSRFLVTQLLVNSAYGIVIAVGLALIGVPNAPLWGFLATFLRFVPYVGPFIAAIFPVTVAFAVDPGWTMLLWTFGLIAAGELASSVFVEPRVYGSSTGISVVAILFAAIFWTTLWGPIGLLLSTPLTVCLAVLGRHVSQLRFLDVLLGSEPVLSPSERIYQRMLSGDVDEGVEIAEGMLRTMPLATFYDEVGLPALRLAEADHASGRLSADLRALVSDTFVRVIADLTDIDCQILENEDGRRSSIVWNGTTVFCIAGRTGLDRAAASMLIQLLERRGISGRLLPGDAISPAGIASLDLAGVELVSLAYLNRSAAVLAEQAVKRIHRRDSEIQVIVGLWNEQVPPRANNDPLAVESSTTTSAHWESSLTGTLRHIEQLASRPIESPMVAAPIPEDEQARLAAVAKINLVDTPPEERFDRFTRDLAKMFAAPISLISLVDRDRQVWKSATGITETPAEAPRSTSICGHVVATKALLVVEDVLKDKRFANNPWLKERGIRFYAGAPLTVDSGPVLGSVCVIDTKPRKVTERDKVFLEFVASQVMHEIERDNRRSLEHIGEVSLAG